MAKNLSLLEMAEKLDEGLLTSEFTMGFELECYIENDSNVYDKVSDRYYDDDDDNSELMEDITDYFTSLLTQDGQENELGGKAGSHEDSSVNSPRYHGDISVEYSSPIIPCKPIWFNRVIKMLTYLFKNGVYTNDTCGFHHHFHFKGMTERDMVWLYCNLCADDSFYNSFSRYMGSELYDESYANYDELDDMKYAINNKDYKEILSLLNTKKWRAFRIHPQGTLEWRGPRGFLDRGASVIPGFYKLVHQLIGNIRRYMDSKVIIGTDITKDELFNGLTKAVDETDPSERPNLEFLSHSESYDSEKKLNYKSKYGSMSEKTIANFTQMMLKKPMVLYYIIMDGNKSAYKILNKIVDEDSYILKYALQKIASKGYATIEFTEKLLNNVGDYDYTILRTILQAGFAEYITPEVVGKALQSVDGIHQIASKIELFKEYKVALNIRSIQQALAKEMRNGILSYETFYMWFMKPSTRILPESVNVKLLMFITKYIVKHQRPVYAPSNDILASIKSSIEGQGLAKEWNELITYGVAIDEVFYKFYIGQKDIKTIFNMIKANPNVVKLLTTQEKQLLHDNEVYI